MTECIAITRLPTNETGGFGEGSGDVDDVPDTAKIVNMLVTGTGKG